MTPQAYSDTVDYLELRWPGTKTYLNADKLFLDFVALPNDVVGDAAHALYAEGRRNAPTLSELLAKATELLRQKPKDRDDPWLNDCDAENRNHRWGIVTLPSSDEERNGIRHTICVLCGAERSMTPKTCPTASEIADRRRWIPEPREEKIAL